MADEPRRSVRTTKGQHTKSLDILDQPDQPKRGGRRGASKKAASQEATSAEEDNENIRCVCGATEQDDDSDEVWICCEQCGAWQHNVCVGMPDVVADSEEYWCEECKPENHEDLLGALEEGRKLWEERRKIYEEANKKGKKGAKRGRKRISDPKSEVSHGTNGADASPAAPDSTPGPKREKKEVSTRAGSAKRKTRDDSLDAEATKGPQSKQRRVSVAQGKAASQEYVSPADVPAKIEELDKTRQGGGKLIHKNMVLAMRLAEANGDFVPSDEESTEQAALRLSLEVERAIYDSHQGSGYLQQCRAISANLKTNQKLCDRLLSGDLTPRALAAMNSDDMATEQMQRQTAEMLARAEKQSIMIQDDGPRVRRTHKGEELVEGEEVPSEELPIDRRRSMLDPNGSMATRSRENTPGNDVDPADTENKTSNDNLRSHVPRHPPKLDTKDSAPTRKSSGQAKNFDLNKIMSSVASPTAHHGRKASTSTPQRQGPVVDPDIDRMLEDGNESEEYEPEEHDADPTIVWRGTLSMNTIADFPAVARHIGGWDLSRHGRPALPWADLIPKRLGVAGRIDIEKANEYLCGLRYSPHTDVVVASLTPVPGEAGATEEFDKLYRYFHDKKRYGVVGDRGIANVRDTYLVPVPPGSGNVPEFLLNLQDHKLPEQHRAEPSILLTLVIRQEIQHPAQAPQAPASAATAAAAAAAHPHSHLHTEGAVSPTTVMTHPQRQMSLGGHSGPSMSPINQQGPFAATTAAAAASSSSTAGTPTTPSIPPTTTTTTTTTTTNYPSRPPFPPGTPNSAAAGAGAGPAPSPSTPADAAEAQRRQRLESQRRGELVAHEILGPTLVGAPTVSFLMPQAHQMRRVEWEVIRDLFREHRRAQEDLTFLSQLLANRNKDGTALR